VLVTDPSIVWLCKGVRFLLCGCAKTFSFELIARMHAITIQSQACE